MNPTLLPDLLRQTPRAGIYQLPEALRRKLPKACAAIGFTCFTVDLQGTGKISEVLVALGRDLGFPDWYGANFDALNDCLSELSGQEAAGYVLIVRGADALRADDPDAFATLNAVFAAASEEWQAQNVPFWVFYDLRASGLAALPTLA